MGVLCFAFYRSLHWRCAYLAEDVAEAVLDHLVYAQGQREHFVNDSLCAISSLGSESMREPTSECDDFVSERSEANVGNKKN